MHAVANKHNPIMTIEDQTMLKAQRMEKLIKMEQMKEDSLKKSETKYLESMLWYEKYDAIAWKTMQQVTRKLNSINGKSNKIKELKNQINIYQKGLGFNDFPIKYSQNKVQKTVEELATMLKDIIRIMRRRQVEPPVLSLPSRKSLPIVGQLSADILAIDSEQSELRDDLETNALEKRNADISNGDQDNFRNLQPATAPALRPGLRIDMLFNYSDLDADDELLMWSQGVIQVVSDGTNIIKEGGGFHKRGDCQVLWDRNESRNEDASSSIVCLPACNFNKYIENSWRLDVNL